MEKTIVAPKRLDAYAFEMIIVLALITLPDFLLSGLVSLPVALHRSTLAQLRSLEHVASTLEFWVPVVLFAAMLILWLIRRNAWERHVAMIYLGWVTLRMVVKIVLIIYIVTSRPQSVPGVLLKDTFVLWIVNFVLFGTWYWIIDAGGPRARRDVGSLRYDFAFPQRVLAMPGWEDWQPRFWDYIFLGFSSNTQFGLGDTQVLSLRAKFLSMLQITLSMAVIVFMASVAISLIH
ncbi:MAG TPA: hypothetical protein VMC09_09790 [Anaerolineales bacterium]|nr:hypothetical protein [Anaerolineales bacterium]